jgi:hypothetical protein
MYGLSKVLAIKIIVTITIWGIPLLFFPSSLLNRLGFPVPEPQLFLRLLGMAYWALVVGYSFGLRAALQGIYPDGIVWVSIVSNGGAFLLLLIGAFLGVWQSWGGIAQAIMWSSVLITCGITVGLVALGPLGTQPSQSSKASKNAG